MADKFYAADAYNKAYGFHKKWSEAIENENDKMWDDIVNEATMLTRKIDTGLFKDLIMTVLCELERISKTRKNPNYSKTNKQYCLSYLRTCYRVKTNTELADKLREEGD